MKNAKQLTTTTVERAAQSLLDTIVAHHAEKTTLIDSLRPAHLDSKITFATLADTRRQSDAAIERLEIESGMPVGSSRLPPEPLSAKAQAWSNSAACRELNAKSKNSFMAKASALYQQIGRAAFAQINEALATRGELPFINPNDQWPMCEWLKKRYAIYGRAGILAE
jgi:hypothetical protein